MMLATACTAAQLSATFKAVPGSAGAGNIVYALNVRNISKRECFVTGIPGITLLDSRGKPLPTNARPSNPGAMTAVIVRLKPGASSKATARFSPDVPPGCNPKAYELRVGPSSGGTLIARVEPPTRLCQRGSMRWTPFSISS